MSVQSSFNPDDILKRLEGSLKDPGKAMEAMRASIKEVAENQTIVAHTKEAALKAIQEFQIEYLAQCDQKMGRFILRPNSDKAVADKFEAFRLQLISSKLPPIEVREVTAGAAETTEPDIVIEDITGKEKAASAAPSAAAAEPDRKAEMQVPRERPSQGSAAELYQRGLAAFERGDHFAADRFFEKAVVKMSRKDFELMEKDAVDQEKQGAWYARALYEAMKNRNYDTAIALFKGAKLKDVKIAKRRIEYLQAEQVESRGEYEQAQKLYSSLAATSKGYTSDYISFLAEMGVVRTKLMQGHSATAAEHVEHHLVDLSLLDPEMLYDFGMYFSKVDPNTGKFFWKAAADHGHLQAKIEYGKHLLLNTQPLFTGDAISYFTDAIKGKPEDKKWKIYVLKEQARALELSQNYNDAIKVYKELAVGHQCVSEVLGIIRCLLIKGRKQEAESWIKVARERGLPGVDKAIARGALKSYELPPTPEDVRVADLLRGAFGETFEPEFETFSSKRGGSGDYGEYNSYLGRRFAEFQGKGFKPNPEGLEKLVEYMLLSKQNFIELHHVMDYLNENQLHRVYDSLVKNNQFMIFSEEYIIRALSKLGANRTKKESEWLQDTMKRLEETRTKVHSNITPAVYFKVDPDLRVLESCYRYGWGVEKNEKIASDIAVQIGKIYKEFKRQNPFY